MTTIYEKADGVIYARKAGSEPSTRIPIARDLDKTPESTFLGMPVSKVGELVAIANAAKTNPALQKALEQCIILYYLSNNPEEPVQHHPV